MKMTECKRPDWNFMNRLFMIATNESLEIRVLMVEVSGPPKTRIFGKCVIERKSVKMKEDGV